MYLTCNSCQHSDGLTSEEVLTQAEHYSMQGTMSKSKALSLVSETQLQRWSFLRAWWVTNRHMINHKRSITV
jgi:uncharacterized metal-binding protein